MMKSEHTATESIGSFAASCLKANGVETVFGIPGTHNIEIYRGLQKYGIRHVLTRHEQGATYAADAYARSSSRVGVVVATSGPGVTNCITGIANAYADSVPLLVLSPGAPRGKERRDLGFLHEAKDQRTGIDNFAAASLRVESREALEEAIHGSFLSFRTERKRPVHIEIPADLLEEHVSDAQPSMWPGAPSAPQRSAVLPLIEALQRAKRPLIIAGGGSIDAAEALTEFVDATGIPIVTTLQGKGVVSEKHHLSAGALAGGSGGFAPISEADFILAFGTELKCAEPAEEAQIARFDIEPEQLHKHHCADFPVLGDITGSLQILLAAEGIQNLNVSAAWQTAVRDAAETRRAAAVAEWAVLHRAVIDGCGSSASAPVILTGDSSQISWLGTVQTAVLEAPRQFLTTDGFATLGYGLPAAIGAKVAIPEAKVVALVGDGALMFSVQELATARDLQLGLPIVVFDNGGYAEIRENMRDAGMRPMAVDLPPPDYAALAKAFHCHFRAAKTPEELAFAVAQAAQADRPTLVHVSARDFGELVWRNRP